jgi:glycosyltransferase involved in cell wall biosynthesis
VELNSKNNSKARFFPKVSIVIPVYNGSDYLKEAIDSALAQTYNNIEIIVVNDGSNDGGKTEEIALSYGDSIRYFRKENGGVATALNFGIDKMNGEYFSWLSHDDLFYPHKTETQINEISKLVDKVVFVFSDFQFINGDNQLIKYFRVNEENKNEFGLCILFNQIHGCTVLIHRNILLQINGFDKQYLTTQDYHAWINIFRKGYDIIHIRDFLVKSRIHDNQGTKMMRDISQREIYEIEKLYITEIVPNYLSHFAKINKHYQSKGKKLYYSFITYYIRNESSFLKKLKSFYCIISYIFRLILRKLINLIFELKNG